MNDSDIEDTRQPPDEPEAVLCEDCGKEMEYHCEFVGRKDREIWFDCTNDYCPDKFDGVAKEMAELIVEQKFLIERIESRVKFLAKKVERLEFHRDEGV